MKIYIFVATINLIILWLYRFLEINLPQFFSNRVLTVLSAILVFSFFSFLLKKKKISDLVTNIQFSILICFICVILFELVFRMVPSVFPENLQHLVEVGTTSVEERKNSVEFLPHNPYAKPKSNTVVHIPGYYGPKENFVYDWLTDKRGFKNTAEIGNKEQIDIVVIGDSFTEGMGVKIEETFSSQLTYKGFSTYSLGVQGYAPFQFQGIYKHFARQLKPKYVIIGYLTGISGRDDFFLKSEKEILEQKQFPSAIGRLVERDGVLDQKPIMMETDEGYQVPVMPSVRHRFAVTALYSLMSQIFYFKKNFNITSGIVNPELDARFMKDASDAEFSMKQMTRYKGEFKNLENTRINSIEQYSIRPYWKLTEKSISNVIKMAREDNAEVILLFFPDRGFSYYEKATGKKLKPDMHPAVELQLMKNFAKKEKIQIIDLSPAFQKYSMTLSESSLVEDFPFLKIDGHPSKKGHELIASELEKYFRNRVR